MKFYGEILIFSMLLLTNGRILFLKRAKKDAIVMLAPLALLLSILQIIAWGVDFFTICALIISVLVVLSNFHALFRYSQRLYIDHYSVLMKVWAAFTIVLAFVALSGLIIFSRVNLNTKKTNVVETKYRLDGSFKSGFYKTSLFSIPNAQITEFSENPTQTHKKVVVVIPDKRCDTENLKPYLVKGQKIAVDGYLKQDRWEKDGQKFSKIQIVANSVQLLGGRSDSSQSAGGAPRFQPRNDSMQQMNQPYAADPYGSAGYGATDSDFPEDIPF